LNLQGHRLETERRSNLQRCGVLQGYREVR